MSTAPEPPPAPEQPDPPPPASTDEEPSELRPLPVIVRVLLYFLGTILIVVGLVGLVLPGLQGILTLALGAAVLSLTSEVANRQLYSVMKRWPAGSRRFQQLRAKMHGWLSRGD